MLAAVNGSAGFAGRAGSSLAQYPGIFFPGHGPGGVEWAQQVSGHASWLFL